MSWFHGDSSPRGDFTDQRWDRDATVASLLEYGPGLYFTSDIDEARNYGGFVYEAELLPSFRLLPHRKPSLAKLREFYVLASEEDREIFLSNWGVTAPAPILKKYAHQDTLYDALVALYKDLFRSADEWVEAVRQLGYDGVVLHLSKREPPREYLIVWSPERLRLTRVE